MSHFLRLISFALVSLSVLATTGSAFAQLSKPARIKLMVDGANLDFWTANSTSFENLLSKLHSPATPPPNHNSWLDTILPNASPPHTNFRGLGGIPGHQVWHMGKEVIGAGNNYGNRMAGDVVFGQIEDFNYNSADGSGSMKVIQVYTAGLGRGMGASTRTVAFRFHVEVQPGGFSVDTKNGADATNVFPNAFAATGIKISAEKAAGFNYKLYAKGTLIDVTAVEKSPNFNSPAPVTNWSAALSQVESALAAEIMATDSTSCIDMMFANEPPASLPAGAEPPFYCLGRCGSPMLINTM